jgi:hypothetical protein
MIVQTIVRSSGSFDEVAAKFSEHVLNQTTGSRLIPSMLWFYSGGNLITIQYLTMAHWQLNQLFRLIYIEKPFNDFLRCAIKVKMCISWSQGPEELQISKVKHQLQLSAKNRLQA